MICGDYGAGEETLRMGREFSTVSIAHLVNAQPQNDFYSKGAEFEVDFF